MSNLLKNALKALFTKSSTIASTDKIPFNDSEGNVKGQVSISDLQQVLGVTRTRQTTQLQSSGYYKITQTSGGLNSIIMAVADGSTTDNAMYAVMFNISSGVIRSVKMSTIVGTRALTLYQKHVNNDVYEIVMALNQYERFEIFGSTYLMQPTQVDSISGYTKITFS